MPVEAIWRGGPNKSVARGVAGGVVVHMTGWAGVVAVSLALAVPRLDAQAPPADAARIQTIYQQGERALAEGRYDAADFQQSRFSEAVVPLRRALALKPALPNIGTLLAMSLSEIGHHEAALPGLEKAFRHQPPDPALRRMAGLHLERTYTALGRDSSAVGIALELSRLYPDDPEVLYHTGRLFGNYAYLQTIKLAKVAPDSVWLHQAAGEANESQGLLDDAIREYRRVLTIAPRRPGIHARLGRVLLARAGQGTGDPGAEAEAVKEFEQELRIDPTNANAAYEIGELARKAGHLDEAIASFRRAVAAYPEFEEALVGLGRTLIAAGAPGDAVPHLRKATGLAPDDDVAFYQLAQAYRALGQETEQQRALAVFKRLRDDKDRQAAAPAERPTVTKQALDPGPR